MELIRGLCNLKPKHRHAAITIGNFDGVHRGHAHLIQELVRIASEQQRPSMLITFEPQPNEFFAKTQSPSRLTRLRGKLRILAQLNLDYVLCLRFTDTLAHLSAKAFIEEILINQLAMSYLYVGDDFRFGYQRQGDLKLLQHYRALGHFDVASMNSYQENHQRISSTAIRHALSQGDLKKAKDMLGHHYAMTGRVAHGNKKGRIIGFPTANIALHRRSVPLHGVYAVKIHGITEQPLFGVANVGNRPTVDGTRSLLEVHIFHFDQDIYGAQLYVEFIYKLRDEKKFDSFDLLKQQIFDDAEQAKAYFHLHHAKS